MFWFLDSASCDRTNNKHPVLLIWCFVLFFLSQRFLSFWEKKIAENPFSNSFFGVIFRFDNHDSWQPTHHIHQTKIINYNILHTIWNNLYTRFDIILKLIGHSPIKLTIYHDIVPWEIHRKLAYVWWFLYLFKDHGVTVTLITN